MRDAGSWLQKSTAFQAFLYERLDAGREDCPIVQALVDGRVQDDGHNYIDIRLVSEKPMLTYTTYERYVEARDKALDTIHSIYDAQSFRIAGRPARVAQRLTGITDGRALDVFTSACAAWLTDDTDAIQLVTGRDITYWYAEQHYCRCSYHGDLGGSCMRSNKHLYDNMFRLYELMAEMAIILCPDCGKLQARTIVWTDTNGKKFHDRIYAGPKNTQRIHTWGARNGIASVYYGSVGDVQAYAPFNLRDTPYLDSMRYCRTCGIIGNHGCNEPYNNHGPKHSHVFPEPVSSPQWPIPEIIVCEGCGARCYDGECSCEIYCGGCEEYHCRHSCPEGWETCGDCGAVYREDESCPNEEYCDWHDEYYHGYDCPYQAYCDAHGCYCADECPEQERCDRCGGYFCGTCPNERACSVCWGEYCEWTEWDGVARAWRTHGHAVCPDEIPCPSCNHPRCPESKECPNGCAVCPVCGAPNHHESITSSCGTCHTCATMVTTHVSRFGVCTGQGEPYAPWTFIMGMTDAEKCAYYAQGGK